jgi:DNA-binding LacI/PurR family transcriptional regulator
MLINRRSGMVAVLIPPVLIYPELLSHLTDRLSAHGMRVLLFTLDGEAGLDELLEQIWTFQVDGLIALTAHFEQKSIAQFDEHNIPVVLYNRQVPGHPVNSVCVDHDEGIRLLVDLLVAAGNKRFLLFSGPAFSDVANERRTIALKYLAGHGISNVPVLYGDFTYQSGRDCFAQWMQDHAAPDAVICSNDMMAIGCIDEARGAHGLKIPEQLSVVGFDGVGAAFLSGYELTTILQPVNQMAKAAVDILVERIENPNAPPEKRVLAGTLVKGSSTRS